MVDALDELRARKLPFAIATTSPKPRVPASVHACGLDDYFPADKIHSGESDFDPPRFKPDPSVYLRVSPCVRRESSTFAQCIDVVMRQRCKVWFMAR